MTCSPVYYHYTLACCIEKNPATDRQHFSLRLLSLPPQPKCCMLNIYQQEHNTAKNMFIIIFILCHIYGSHNGIYRCNNRWIIYLHLLNQTRTAEVIQKYVSPDKHTFTDSKREWLGEPWRTDKQTNKRIRRITIQHWTMTRKKHKKSWRTQWKHRPLSISFAQIFFTNEEMNWKCKTYSMIPQ